MAVGFKISPIALTLSLYGCFGAAVVDLPEGAVQRLGDRSIRHPSGWETVLAASPDGTLLVTGAGRPPSAASTSGAGLLLWDRATRRVLATLSRHSTPLSVAFSPDGWRVLSGDANGQVDEWDVTQRRRRATMATLEGPATAVGYSDDGRRIVAAEGRTGRIRLFDADTGRATTVLEVGSRVFTARFLPTGVLAVATERGVAIWDADGTLQHRLDGPRHEVLALGVDRAGKRLVASGFDGIVFVWNLADRSLERQLPVSPGHVVRCVDVSPDGATIAAGSVSQPNDIYVWGPDTPRTEPSRMSGHEDSVHAARFLHDGTLVTADYRGVVRAWDVANRRPADRREGHAGRVMTLAWLDDNHLLSGGRWTSDDSRLRLWDLARGGSVAVTDVEPVAISRRGDWIALPQIEHGLVLASLRLQDGRANRTPIAILREVEARGGDFSHDSLRFVVATNQDVRVHDVASGAVHRRWAYPDTPNVALFSPDARFVAAGGYDNHVRVYDVDDDLAQPALEQHQHAVQALAWSPEGDRIVSASEDATLILWDPLQGRALRTLAGHQRGVWAVDWSADGDRIASAGLDGTVRLWDARSGRSLVTYRGHPGYVFAVRFDPGSRRLASAGDDDTVLLWAVH